MKDPITVEDQRPLHVVSPSPEPFAPAPVFVNLDAKMMMQK